MGLSTRGTTEPKPNSVCWTQFPKDFSVAGTLKVLLPHSALAGFPLVLWS